MKILIGISLLLCLISSGALSQTFLRDCPDTQYKAQLDSCCESYGSNLPIDTLYGPYPPMHYETYWASLSPDGRYLASTVILVDWWSVPERYWDGFIISDVSTHQIIEYRGGAAVPRYSPDGKRILTTSYVYEPGTNNVYPFPSPPNGVSYTLGEWSVDGKYVYMGSSAGVFRWTATCDSIMLVHPGMDAIPFGIDSLIYLYPHQDQLPEPGYQLISLDKDENSFVQVPGWADSKIITNISVAPNGRMLAFDVTYSDGNLLNDKHGLCIFDRWTNRMKQVLPAQAFMNRYHPSWTTHGTLIISYVCRKDSSYTIWEVDTNGVFLRQLTDRSIFNITTAVSQPEHIPISVSITGVYPQPSTGTTIVEYTLLTPGAYAIAVVDVLGRERYRMNLPESGSSMSGSVSVQTSDLSPGLYVIQICGRRGVEATKTIIVDR